MVITILLETIREIESFLGPNVRRSDMVRFYTAKLEPLTHFIATMIWGHAAPQGGRPDNRGPWKVAQMINGSVDLAGDLKKVRIDTEANAIKSYNLLDSKRNVRLGPNFFTKHFYFLGKASKRRNYPLIFDNRVAIGLQQLLNPQSILNEIIDVSAARNANAYIEYLQWARNQNLRIGCDLDKIELFLFDNMYRQKRGQRDRTSAAA